MFVSVIIFTLNEEIHLPTCLESLRWCDDIIVVDSYSTDKTQEICRLSGVRFFQNTFEGFGKQRNWALDNIDIKHDWLLILDADERVPLKLANEMQTIAQNAPDNVAAYRLRRRFYMWGHWLKYSSLYPTWVVRFVHKDRIRYINRGHAETQEVQGEIRQMKHDLIDENLKGIDEWFERQNRYSRKEAEYEIQQETKQLVLRNLFARDPLKRRHILKQIAWKMPGRAFFYFLYSFIWRKGFLDGRAGLNFCIMKAIYQYMIQIKKYDLKNSARNYVGK